MFIMSPLRKMFFVLLASVFNAVSSKPSGYFLFPTLKASVLTGRENATYTLPFEIGYDAQFDISQNFSLIVSRKTSFQEAICLLLHKNGKCYNSRGSSTCTCKSDFGQYQLQLTLDRSDNVPWIWSTDNGAVERKKISFNVLYPASVEDVTVASNGMFSSLVNIGSAVNVTCHFDQGNPPVTARLLDSHGIEMEGSIYSSGQFRYRFPAVGCQDAGLIRCEAPGAEQNKTANLLVRCVPELQVLKTVSNLGGTMDVRLRVRTHSAIQGCRLRRQNSEIICRVTAVDSAQLVRVLTVRLDNVRKQDEGQWTLTLTNDVGHGHTNISLSFENEVDSASNAAPQDKISVLTYIATIVAVVLIVAIISCSVSITVIYVKKGSRTDGIQAARQIEPILPWPANLDLENRSSTSDSTSSQKSTNTYDEVQDAPLRLNLDVPRLPTRHCQAPSEAPDDYLHPVPSRSNQHRAGVSSENSPPVYRDCSSKSLKI